MPDLHFCVNSNITINMIILVVIIGFILSYLHLAYILFNIDYIQTLLPDTLLYLYVFINSFDIQYQCLHSQGTLQDRSGFITLLSFTGRILNLSELLKEVFEGILYFILLLPYGC